MHPSPKLYCKLFTVIVRCDSEKSVEIHRNTARHTRLKGQNPESNAIQKFLPVDMNIYYENFI